jgi:hypothetical protein
MAITVNIYYSGKDGNAEKFAREMTASGVVADIRAENVMCQTKPDSPMKIKNL